MEQLRALLLLYVATALVATGGVAAYFRMSAPSHPLQAITKHTTLNELLDQHIPPGHLYEEVFGRPGMAHEQLYAIHRGVRIASQPDLHKRFTHEPSFVESTKKAIDYIVDSAKNNNAVAIETVALLERFAAAKGKIYGSHLDPLERLTDPTVPEQKLRFALQCKYFPGLQEPEIVISYDSAKVREGEDMTMHQAAKIVHELGHYDTDSRGSNDWKSDEQRVQVRQFEFLLGNAPESLAQAYSLWNFESPLIKGIFRDFEDVVRGKGKYADSGQTRQRQEILDAYADQVKQYRTVLDMISYLKTASDNRVVALYADYPALVTTVGLPAYPAEAVASTRNQYLLNANNALENLEKKFQR